MKMSQTLQEKRDLYARMQRSNYLASLRLEGFITTPDDVQKPLQTRAAVIEKYRKMAG
jgi:hypothetical protein